MWSYIDGKLLIVGVDALTLPADRLLNVVFAMLSDSFGEVNRTAIIDEVEKYLRGVGEIDRETWGADPAYTQEQRGIISAYGPPPGFTPKRKE